MTDDELIRRGDARKVADEVFDRLEKKGADQAAFGAAEVCEAIAALPAQGVKIKPLEWRETTAGTAKLTAWKSDGGTIVYNHTFGEYIFRTRAFPTLDAAKAAAQADYERRILAALAAYRGEKK